VSAFGWGANLDKDAIYPSTKDSDGAPLVGANTYIIHFAKGETPPVDGFWPITMYDGSYYFYPNALNKLTEESMREMRMYWPKATPPSILDGTWSPPAREEGWLRLANAHATVRFGSSA
jgi:hypothetical protein